MVNQKYIITVLFFCLIYSTLIGQDSLALPAENVQVIKQFEPNIAQARALEFNPTQTDDQVLPAISMNYELSNQVLDIEYPDPIIKPLVYEDKQVVEKNNGYVKAGYGNLNSPLAEGQIHYDIQDWFQTGLSIKHYSARDSIELLDRSIAKTKGNFYTSYFLTDLSKVTAEIDYANITRSVCCLQDTLDSNERKIKTNNYGASLQWDHNSFSVNGFSTKQNLKADRLNSSINNNEWLFGYSSFTQKSLKKNLLLNLNLDAEMVQLKNFDESQWHYSANPNISYKKNKLKLSLGAFVSNADTLYLRPSVLVDYQLPWKNFSIEGSFEPSSGINSLHHLNSFMDFYFGGLYVIQNQYYQTENAQLNLNWRKKNTDAKIGVYMNNFKDKAVYYQLNPDALFHGIYFGDFIEWGARLQGKYKFSKYLEVLTNTSFSLYRQDGTFIHVNYLPQLDANLTLRQNPLKGLYVYETLTYMHDRMASQTEGAHPANSYFEIGAGMEYLFKNKIGVFFEANNLTNQDNMFYSGLPSFGVNFHGGLKYVL